MKPLRLLAQAILLSAALFSAHSQTTTDSILGQWDFNTAQLETATIGSPLQFIGGVQPTLSSALIGTNSAGVMAFPALTSEQAILATFAPTNNGGGTNLNQYTIIMDVMYPPESEVTWRPLFNTETNNATDAEAIIDLDGRITIRNELFGTLNPGTWYRLAFAVNTTSNVISVYINGTNTGTNTVGAVDGRFSVNDGVLFFSDRFGDTGAGYVNVIQLRAGAMTDAEIAALGGPASNGLGEGGGAPVGDVNITGILYNSANNTITITVDNKGRNVQLQTSPTIVNPTWSNVGAPSATGTFTVPNNGSVAFFRVEVR